MKRVGQRVLGLWRQRAAGAYLRTWRTAVRAKLRLRKASNAVQRLASGRLRTTGWREWVVHVEDRLHRTRLRTRASVFARKREREKLRLCLDGFGLRVRAARSDAHVQYELAHIIARSSCTAELAMCTAQHRIKVRESSVASTLP
jgi:hypothetical protein